MHLAQWATAIGDADLKNLDLGEYVSWQRCSLSSER